MLRTKIDFIVLDCPAGIEAGFLQSIRIADEALIVVNPEVSSMRDADRVASIIEANSGSMRMNLIINRYEERLSSEGHQLKLEEIDDILSLPVIGVIPYDEEVIKTSNRGEILGNGTVCGKVFEDMARRMRRENIPVRTSFKTESLPDAEIRSARRKSRLAEFLARLKKRFFSGDKVAF